MFIVFEMIEVGVRNIVCGGVYLMTIRENCTLRAVPDSERL